MSSSLEDIKSIDIEEWLTLATAPSSTKLKQGQSPDMQNVWTDEKPGSVITAPGFLKVGSIPSGNPVSFCINYFKTSAGTQTFVVSDNSTVWTTIDFQTFTQIITGLSSSFQLRGAVIRDKLWLTNGSDAIRVFDGSNLSVLDGTSGTPNVPRGRYIAYHDERVWLYHGGPAVNPRSVVYFSSLTDSSANIIDPDNVNAWDTTDNYLQISEGDADFGTGMIIYRGYLHFFKQYSIWRLVGYDEYTYSRVKTRASTGTRFQESVQILDSLVHLIGVDGIYVFDGEESVRISDIIDPATASQTAFGFNQLQQPNQNNKFWELSSTSDWNTGSISTNLAVDNAITAIPADDSQADFAAGVTQTNTDIVSNPGFLQLGYIGGAGHSTPNIFLNQPAGLGYLTNASLIGTIGRATDGDLTNQFGAAGSGNSKLQFEIDYGNTALQVSTIILKGFITNNAIAARFELTTNDDNFLTPTQTSLGVITSDAMGPYVSIPRTTDPTDVVITFGNNFTGNKIVFLFTGFLGTVAMTEVQGFTSYYDNTGQFISKRLDMLVSTPSNLGNFSASEVVPGNTTTSYFTQSSADGLSWDAPVSCTNGGPIGSLPRRYLRWGVNLTSDGSFTPIIDSVFLPAIFVSPIHDTGGSIFSWGPFESVYSLLGGNISFYYKGATTSGGIASASFLPIVPPSILGIPTSFRFVQYKIEVFNASVSALPAILSTTINWVVGSGTQPQTLQNVASTYWRNRYWLSAAGPSATSNNTILIRGKKTFQSPWMLKDWNILSFARFYDSLYGGSSTDGSIYQLDTGYSKNGSMMDSYFETSDFVFGGFTANMTEILVEVERTGSWNLLVGVSVDGGNTFVDYPVDLSVSTFDSNYLKRINNISFTTTRFRLRFRTNGVDTPFQVHRCIIFYKLLSARGSIRGDYM